MHRLYLIFLLTFLVFSQTKAQDSTVINKGIELYNRGEYDSSLVIFHTVLDVAKKSDNKKALMIIYNYIGHIHSQKGDHAGALHQYQLLTSTAEETGDNKTLARALINLGALAEEQKDYVKALTIYSKAEEIAIKLNDNALTADCANNKGVVYEQYLQNYPQALKEYNYALNIYTGRNDLQRMGMSYNNIGIVYKYLGQYDKAIEYYQNSLEIGEKTGNQFLIAANMTNIGNVYAMQKNYLKAIDYNKQGLELALKIDALNIVVEAASSIADDYAGMKDYAKAYEWHQKFSSYSDSLFNSERTQQVAELEGKYKSVKNEKEIFQLKEQEKITGLLLQKKKYQLIGFTVIGLLSMIVLILLYNQRILKQKQAQEKAILDAEYKERKRISSEMHDDMGAGLTQITLMSEHARNRPGEHQKEFQDIAVTSRKLISNMSEIVWSLNPENKTLEQLFSYLREQMNKLLEYSGIEFTINFPEISSSILLTNEQRRTFLLVTKEIVNNAVKHSNAKNILIEAVLTNNKLQFIIKDDGIGFDASTSHPGNGMKNIRQRINEIKGDLTIKSDQSGSIFTFSVPIG
ncbi:MAG: tetratricopeptide repeat protein [Bacteroidota bacterium]